MEYYIYEVCFIKLKDNNCKLYLYDLKEKLKKINIDFSDFNKLIEIFTLNLSYNDFEKLIDLKIINYDCMENIINKQIPFIHIIE